MQNLEKRLDLDDAALWEETEHDFTKSEDIKRKSLTFYQDVWRRFSHNRTATVSLVFIAILTMTAIFLPYFWKYTYSDQNLDYSNIPCRLALYKIPGGDTLFYITSNYNVLQVAKDGALGKMAEIVSNNSIARKKSFALDGREIMIDYSQYFAAKKRLYTLRRAAKRGENVNLPAEERNFENMKRYIVTIDGKEAEPVVNVWNKNYILGNDALGRDLFIRIIYGARISLAVGFATAFVCFIIGVLFGGISGYYGGKVDEAMMRVVDIINTIPTLLYVILLRVLFDNGGLFTIILTIGLTYWVGMARLVRGEVLSLKKQEFVLAAKSLGAPTRHILLRHLLPNIMGPVMVTITMMIPNAIFTEAFLSFVGLGVSAPIASWGTLCNDALEGLYTFPQQLLFPAAAISLTILTFNLLGDGLRDALDPKQRK
ncbi:MAG: ABC transporter permease [bacterium]|nr:ABC transporter permease [bacterium]